MSCREEQRSATEPFFFPFFFGLSAAQGGDLLHSGVLVALTGSIFESNMAGKDGLAVMSLGMAEKIADSSFRNNSFFCASGKYGMMKDRNETEVCLFLLFNMWTHQIVETLVLLQQYGFSTQFLSRQNIFSNLLRPEVVQTPFQQ